MGADDIKRIEERLAELENSQEKPDSNARIRCLRRMLMRAKEQHKLIKPQIFVSFTGKTGQEIMVQVMRKINATKAPGINANFHACSGMDQRGDGQPEVLDHIIRKMKPCCLFVGILTREWAIAAEEGSGTFSPGGWALLETGMALSLGLRVIFFIDQGINPEFWRLYLGHVRHVLFEPSQYMAGMGSLISRVEEAYRGLRLRSIEETS